jgi:hypothetical protein
MPEALQLCHFLTALFMMDIKKGLPDTSLWCNSRNADLCMGFSWLWAVMSWKECIWNLVTDTSWFNIYFHVFIVSVCTFVSRILTFFIRTYVTKYLFSNYIRNNKTKHFYVVLNILGQITVETVNSSLQEVCTHNYFFPCLCLALHASYM